MGVARLGGGLGGNDDGRRGGRLYSHDGRYRTHPTRDPIWALWSGDPRQFEVVSQFENNPIATLTAKSRSLRPQLLYSRYARRSANISVLPSVQTLR